MPKYLGLEFQQGDDAPRLLTFVAPAHEIRAWGGVPQKSPTFVGGFQRPLSKRYLQITEFFNDSKNVSPTAIVVAFRPGTITVKSIPIEQEFSSLARPVEIEVETPTFDGLSIEELAIRVRAVLTPRVLRDVGAATIENGDGGGSASEAGDDAADGSNDAEEAFDADVTGVADVSDSSNGSNESDTSGETDESDEPVPVESMVSDEWGVDVGRSELRAFCECLATAEGLKKLDERIKADLLGGDDPPEPDELQKRSEDTLREVLESLLLPAMIVDGQHRVWGAAESDREVPFAVCALHDSVWDEQVFHFIVINKQARAISGELLASIVNSSLTNREIEALEGRLDHAGIDTYETKILRTLNDDPDSPFQGLIAKGIDESGKKITFKAAIALASRWRKKMTDRDSVYKTLFRPGLKGANNTEKALEWASVWKNYFFGFWWAIRNMYEPEHLWDPGMQLMYRATLETLQDNFLESKALAGQSIADPVSLRESVTAFYSGVPAAFFVKEWKRKELLTEDGRRVLKHAMNEMRVPGARLQKLVKTDPLFTTGGPRKKAGQ